ncbi:MAG: NAD(P)-dependent oxidoreductase [Flavobacteriaceae bacterium]|nr:NAD(P)-dependent oxidoreductase [Flavobacteriaceae bacterium]
MKKILVTGVAGYIGSVLTRQLLNKGYAVRGLDKLNFGGESLISILNNPNFEFVKGDIRNETDVIKAIDGVDGVVHLAAIVGDPACSKEPEIAESTNWEGAKLVFDISNKNNNVKRFVFASTCSNYGKMEGDGFVNEKSDLSPVSLYAKLKVKFEKHMMETEIRNDFIPTALRFSTVYGLSPRLRFDLTVNEFVREVAVGNELLIFGEQFWRPYCHVEDLARACVLVLESPSEKVRQNVFGVGDTNENYQKKMLADEILKVEPNAKIKYVKRDEDPRDYRVDFSKIKNELGFEITKRVPDGIREIHDIIKNNILTNPFSDNYKNI